MNTRFLRLRKSPKSTAKPKISSDEVFESIAILYSKRPQRSEDHRTGLGIFFGGPELPKNQKNQKKSRPVQRLLRFNRQPLRSNRHPCGPTATPAVRPPFSVSNPPRCNRWRFDRHRRRFDHRHCGLTAVIAVRPQPPAVRPPTSVSGGRRAGDTVGPRFFWFF